METRNYRILSLAFMVPVNSGSMNRIQYSKLYSLVHTLLLNVFSTLKGTNFYILFLSDLFDLNMYDTCIHALLDAINNTNTNSWWSIYCDISKG